MKIILISIHAPPRGATTARRGFPGGSPISIHAPPRGATIPNCATRTFAEYFNSRPSARGDVALAHVFHSRNISIHAPPRGATLRSALSSRAPSNFNSRPSARGDFGFGAQRIHRMLFQFTPLREGRLCDSLRASSKHSFQFTPLREGRRARRDRTQHRRQISIHAPPRGATNEVIRQRKKRNISIHAPPRGATTLPAAGILNRRHFNSRPSARGDGTVSKSALCVIRFQFTPLREGRLPRMLSEGEAGENFNSRPSARGDQT